MDIMFWVWLGILVSTLIIEFVTFELVSIWFTVGAIIPFILSAIGGVHLAIQISVFFVVSAVLIIFIRKYAQKFLFKNMNTKTNVDSLVGQRCRLLEDVNFEKNGSVKVGDVIWTAKSEKGETLNKDDIVEVVAIEGNKLIVKKVEEIKEEK